MSAISFRIQADLIPHLNEMEALKSHEQQEQTAIPEVKEYAKSIGYHIAKDTNGSFVIYERDPFNQDAWITLAVFRTLSDAKNRLRTLKIEEDKHYDEMAEEKENEVQDANKSLPSFGSGD